MSGKAQAIENLAKEMTWWKTIHLKTRETVNFVSLTEDFGIRGFKYSDYEYFETSNGERYSSFTHILFDDAQRRQENYFDGRKGAVVHYQEAHPEKQQSVAIGPAFDNEAAIGGTARPMPFKFFYVGKSPLYEALDHAKFLGVVSGPLGTCEKYEFDDAVFAKVKLKLHYYLDEKTSIPHRVDAYDASGVATSHPNFTWEAKAVEIIDGHPFVTASVETNYDHRSGGKEVLCTIDVETKEVRFNTAFQKGSFRPVIEPGAIVHDAFKKKTILPPREQAPTPTNDTAAIAVSPLDWTSYASYTAYGVGALLLLACVVVRLRGR